MRRSLTLAGIVILLTGLVTAQRAPAPVPTGFSADQIVAMCAPAPADLPDRAPVASPVRVTGGQAPIPRGAFAQGDLVTISAGERQGITVGQRFYTRRPGQPITKKHPLTQEVTRTSGWITVYAVDPDLALATVSHACTTVEPGDVLAPLQVPELPATDLRDLEPKRGDYARVTTGRDGRLTFGAGDVFLIDRGSRRGVQPGARFVLYHDRLIPGNFLYETGEAVAIAVGADASTLRVLKASSAIVSGDYAGQRTETPRQKTAQNTAQAR